MIRRLNFTGRKRLAKEHVAVTVLREADGPLAFQSRLDLASYGFPDDAEVWVEASQRTAFMRFALGTVAKLQPLSGGAAELTEFSVPEGLSFRAKVTAVGSRAGVLLGEADEIPVHIATEVLEPRSSLLPTVGQDLGEEVWQLDFDGANGPALLVNKRLDWKAVASGVIFRTLVYPAALREILWHVYKIRGTRDPDDTEDWGAKWLRFGELVPGAGDAPFDSEDEREWLDWIDDVVEVFARKHKLLDHFVSELKAEATG